MRLKRPAVNHINRSVEKTGHILFEAHVIVDRSFRPGSKSTKISTSLSGRFSPRATEPNTAACATPRACKAPS